MLDDRRAQDRCNADAASFSASSENLEEFMRRLNIKDNQRGQNADINPYPHRPDEPNCSYFIRTGQCGYGSHCRFNHPPPIGKVSTFGGELPERPGQPDCQFFLKTGTCKFGATCKYHHPCDKLMQLQVSLNTLGLPLRQEEKPCSYYMRNGSCKFGFACKFHHPEPAMGTVFHEASSSSYGFSGSTVASQSSMFPFLGGNPPWMPLQQSLYLTAQNSLGFPAFIPGIISPSHDVAAGQQAWGIYVGGMSSTDIPAPDYQHPYLKPQRQLSSVPLGLLPERPDQPDCQYFLKTGRCKYGSACKYHHPREKTSFSIGPHMLPLRPVNPNHLHFFTIFSL